MTRTEFYLATLKDRLEHLTQKADTLPGRRFHLTNERDALMWAIKILSPIADAIIDDEQDVRRHREEHRRLTRAASSETAP